MMLPESGSARDCCSNDGVRNARSVQIARQLREKQQRKIAIYKSSVVAVPMFLMVHAEELAMNCGGGSEW